MKALVIGGTSGLGLELATILSKQYETIITGRTDPEVAGLTFVRLDLAPDNGLPNPTVLDSFVDDYSPFDLVVYAAGFYQEGLVSALTDEQIHEMLSVGVTAPIMLMQRIMKQQDQLGAFIAITSTSQYTPRLLEPVYTAANSGLQAVSPAP